MSVDKGITILLVEDSAATRKMEIMIIKKLGFTNIHEAEDGDIAVELLSGDFKADLVIADWNMPNMDGLSLLKWIREHEVHADTPFIMATGQGQKSQAKVAFDAGVNAVVPKPFTPDDLMKKMEQIFSGEAMPAEGPKVRTPRVTPEGKVKFSIAHIQITDHLVLGVLQHLIKTGELQPKHFELDTVCMPGWNPVQNNLENGEIDGAFVLAPIAMDLFNFGVPIKLVLFAHRNGSIFVRNKRMTGTNAVEFFKDKTFYIPHQMSIHHMLAHMYLSELGLVPGVPGKEGANVMFEVVPPIKMPEFLATNAQAAGFLVAEPLGTKAIAANIAQLQFLSGEAWENHPCCVVTMRDEIVQQHQKAVQEFVSMLVTAGKFVARRPEAAAQIAVDFLDPQKKLGLTTTVLKNVLTEKGGITTDDLYPEIDDLDAMQRYMHDKMGIGGIIDLHKFVDQRFADAALPGRAGQKQRSKLHEGALVRTVNAARAAGSATKIMLDKEGKYLLLSIEGEEFGIGIRKIREIIGMMPITEMPRLPGYFPGVINLRGKVIAVLDLRQWFDLPAREYDDRTAIIVVENDTGVGMDHLGIIVDSVAEIVDINADNVESLPGFGTNKATEYILAMAKFENTVKILLDIDSMFHGVVRDGVQAV